MSEAFDECGIEAERDELLECKDAYIEATKQAESQCEAQTLDAIKFNLKLKGGNEDFCTALEQYAAQ